MPEEFPTLKEDMPDASSATGSPDPDASGTTDDPSPADAKSGDPDGAQNDDGSQDTKAGDQDDGAGDPGSDDGKGDKLEPFHDHPRWQQVQKERDDAVEKAASMEKKMNSMQSQLERLAASPQPTDRKGTERDYDKELSDLTADMDSGAISQAEFSKKMVSIMRDQNTELLHKENARMLETIQKDQKAQAIEQAFYREHPDFDGLLSSGKIAEVKGTSPMHDDFSAYWAAKYLDVEKQTEEKIAAARKDERAKTIKEIQAGKNATTLDGKGAPKGPAPPSDKKNLSKMKIKESGGLNKVLAERLRNFRQSRQGG